VTAAEAQASSPAPHADALSWAVLLLLVVIWGSAFAAIKIGVETISPMWFVAGRLVTATIFLGACLAAVHVFGRRRERAAENAPLTLAALAWYAGIGVFFTALPFTCYAIAGQSISSAAASICNGGTPFFTALLAHALVHGEKLTTRKMIGVIVGFAGLAVLVWPDFARGESASAAGLAIAIFGAALYAGSNVGTRIGPKLSPLMSSLVIVAGGAAAMLVVSLLFEPFPAAPSAASIAAMIFLALMATGLGFILWVWLIRRVGSVFVSFTTYLSPLWAAGLGVVFLGEELHPSMIGALALILVGVAVANRRPRAQVRLNP
jgi:drug/metabolite transporter (DMT)-like permease